MAKTPRSRKSPPTDPTPPSPQTDPVVGAAEQAPGGQSSVTDGTTTAADTPVPAKRRPAAKGAPAATAGATAQTPSEAKAKPAQKATKAPVRRTGAVAKPAPAKAASKDQPKPASPNKTVKKPVAAAPPPAADTAAETAAATPARRGARTLAEAVQKAGEATAASRGLRILMVASEAVPFAKTGGLADVVAALPKALGALGHQVTVVIPRYRGISVSGAPTMSYDVAMGGHDYRADVFVQETSPGVRVALVDHPAFFDRDALYGLGSHDYGDNPRRFAFLSLAALELARREAIPVDVVHAHDWQGALAPVYVKTRYASDPVLGGAATVFTIHNIAYQGNCSSEWLPQLGLGWEVFTTNGLEFWLHASLLKGGIMFADLVTTVSPRYARELTTPEFAFGFEGIVRHRSADMVGILNGIDADVWNPATDPSLPVPYSADDLSGKREAKRRLLAAYGLPDDDDALRRPVVAMISRMVDQKGLDLIAAVAEQLPHLGASFVVLGTGEPWYEEMWRSLARRFPERIGVRIGFDEPLSHLIEGGADVFMMPSRFEPCGLNQMYSLRYGTLPVVRATGGLDDTVQNYDPATGAGNGFKFFDATGEALLGTLRWALHVYGQEPDRWRQLQRAGMAVDFSWQASARAYVSAYERALAHVARGQGASA